MTEVTPPPAPPTGPASAPIPPMPRYYRHAAERPAWLRGIFDDTAADYDRVERWLSLGTGAWYRRQALKRAGLAPGMKVADVACGTGLVAREAVKIVGDGALVVGIDPSPGMLQRAAAGLGIETVVARAESLPFADATFDFVSMGYALRHVDDLAAAFGEFRRVLRPGGRVCILEISAPRSGIGRAGLRAYMAALTIGMRAMGVAPRTPELWRYYWETIDKCVAPPRVIEALAAAGFVDAKREVELGVFSEFTGRVAG